MEYKIMFGKPYKESDDNKYIEDANVNLISLFTIINNKITQNVCDKKNCLVADKKCLKCDDLLLFNKRKTQIICGAKYE